MIRMFKEPFLGKYNGVTPPTLLPVGAIPDGKNIRKVSQLGGWKVRKGNTLHNSSAIAASPVLSLHQYENPRLGDSHFIAQCDGKLYEGDNNPPSSGTSFQASGELYDGVSSSRGGFSCIVESDFFYADGSGRPLMWGGDTPYCRAFISYDASGSYTGHNDFTREVTNDRTDLYGKIYSDSANSFYICSPCRAKGVRLVLGTGKNTNSATLSLEAFQGSSGWSSRSISSDGTSSGGATLAQSGTILFSEDSDDALYAYKGTMGFWYHFSYSANLSQAVDVVQAMVIYDPAELENKWNGVYEWPSAVRRYIAGSSSYEDYSGSVTNESTSQYIPLDGLGASADDAIYIKTPEPAAGFMFGIVPEYGNTASYKIGTDDIEVWSGSAWSAATPQEDGTVDGGKGFARSGVVYFDASSLTARMRTFAYDTVPGYWYKVKVTGELNNDINDIRLYLVAYIPFPEPLGTFKGCVEFNPDCFSGSDSGWTDEFGDESEIVAATKFFNELVVLKESRKGIYLLEGYSPTTYGSLCLAHTVGCSSPNTVVSAEVGFPDMHRNEAVSVIVWMESDGIYVIDGRKPKKVSLAVDHYFNTEYATAISASYLDKCSAFADPLRNEYHLLVPDGTELVYNYLTDEWYPPWEREMTLRSGCVLQGTDGRPYTYGGSSDGFVLRLENDTTDKNSSNSDVAIEHSLKTRAISADPKQATTLEFLFRRVWIEAKARSSGEITTKLYKDLASSGETLAKPSTMSLVNSGYSLATPSVGATKPNCKCFQLEFSLNSADIELEIWSFLYQISLEGVIE